MDHVGLSFRKLEEAGAAASAARVRDAGLRVSDLGELGWWSLDDPATWAAQQDRVVRALDAAVIADAPTLILTSGPAGALPWDDALASFTAALEPIRSEARARNIRLALENTSSLRLDLSFVTTLRDTVDAATALTMDVCLEVNSCFAERRLPETIRRASPRLAIVQVSDFVIGSLCTPDRAVPGDGHIPLEPILRTLVGTGYVGPFELELVGPRIEEEGYPAAIRRGIDALTTILAGLDRDSPVG